MQHCFMMGHDMDMVLLRHVFHVCVTPLILTMTLLPFLEINTASDTVDQEIFIKRHIISKGNAERPLDCLSSFLDGGQIMMMTIGSNCTDWTPIPHSSVLGPLLYWLAIPLGVQLYSACHPSGPLARVSSTQAECNRSTTLDVSVSAAAELDRLCRRLRLNRNWLYCNSPAVHRPQLGILLDADL